MEHPAVSVIIPVWNSGKYFRECLDSVLSQSLRNIEVLIVDDASTDGSGAVAEEYASRDARITVMHQPSSTGAGPARNRAMAVARGEYIAFMDSDDLYPSTDVLETLYRKAVEHHANICGGSLYKIDAKGNILNKKIPDQFFIKEEWCSYYNYQYDGGFYRFIYKNNFIKCNKLFFPKYRRFQDAIFFVHAMNKAKKFYAICKYTYVYRKFHKKLVWDMKKINDHLDGLMELIEFSNMNNYRKLHYLMAKNLLDTIRYKMNRRIDKMFFVVKVIKCINRINFYSVKNYGNVKIRRSKYILYMLM